MANPHLSKSIPSSIFGSIDVCQTNFAIGGLLVTDSSSQIDPSTNFSIQDFSSVYNAAKYIPFTKQAASNMLTTGGLRDDDIAWSTNKESFNDAISWLWGNLESGGVGFAVFSDTPSNRVTIIESHGIYYNEELNYEKIGNLVNNDVSKYNVEQAYLSFIYRMTADSADTRVFMIARKNNTTPIPYQIFTSTLGIPSYSDVVYTNSLGVVTDNAWNHEYLGRDYPDKIFSLYELTFLGDEIIVYHPNYDFEFGAAYVAEGSVDEGDDVDEEDNDQGGTSTTGGGGGGFDNSSDSSNRVTESQFSIDAINSGFVSVYMPNQSNIQAFCNFLFSGITEDVSIVLKRLVSNPLDYVISMNMIHFTPTTGSSEEIKFCGIGSGVNAPRVTKQMHIIDCGSLDIEEQYNTFLDYNGHTKVKIYLPYCGIFPLEINEIMGACSKNGGRLSLQYIVDILTGSCIAQLYVTRYRDYVGKQESFIDDRLMYEFTGNVFEQVPLSAVDYRGTIQGLMQIAGGAISVASGNAGGVGAVASGVMNLAPDVIHSGNGSTSFGYMGVQTPFIFFERQIQNLPVEFQSREGYTSNIYVSKLNDITGYTEIDIESFKTEYIKCTDAEREELIKILNGGFII